MGWQLPLLHATCRWKQRHPSLWSISDWQLCADNKGNQEACFEEDACEVIVNCLKRYPGDRDVQLHALWAAVAITNGHASSQTGFALDGGFDAHQSYVKIRQSLEQDEHIRLILGRMLDNAINGKAVNIHDCQFFKCEYEDDEEEDENWGDLPGEKASEVIPEMIGIILNEASSTLYTGCLQQLAYKGLFEGCFVAYKIRN